MKLKLIKLWLKIKLRQISTTGGLAIMVVWAAKQFGYEIPPEYMPSLENIGMALAGLILIFLKESGETDAIRASQSADEFPPAEPLAIRQADQTPTQGPTSAGLDSATPILHTRLRSQPTLSPKSEYHPQPESDRQHGFNG